MNKDAYLSMSADELAGDPAVQAYVLEGRDAAAWRTLAAGHPAFAQRLAQARGQLEMLAGFLDRDDLSPATPKLDAEAHAVWTRIERRTRPEQRKRRARRAQTPRRLRRWGGIALAAAAAIALLVVLLPGRLGSDYRTGPGELLAVELPDGSAVTLGPTTNLEILSYEGERRLRLEGEAYFDVERGTRFSVETAAGKVAVLGTTFTINAGGTQLAVACATGRVAVVTPADSVALSPGRAARVTEGVLDTFAVNVAQIGTWRFGTLVYEDEPLVTVAAELERYFARPVIVAPQSQQRRITAELPVDDFAAAVSRLEFLLQTPVDTTGGALRIE